MSGPSSGGGRSRRRRLSRSAEFERVYRQGRSKANRFLVLYAFPREDGSTDDGPRLGLSVSRRVGGAVDRTRVKRVLREAFWQEAERLPDGSDYVVVARPESLGTHRARGHARDPPCARRAGRGHGRSATGDEGRRVLMSAATRIALAPIRLYQRVISPALPRRCKYHPTCSDYAVQAIRSYGILRGAVLAGWRLLRCNPFSHGGYDPVSAQTLFTTTPRSAGERASNS